MKLLDIAKKVGGGLLKSFIPGGPAVGAIIDVVNAKLFDGDKLDPETATGSDLLAAVGSLPPDEQAELLSRQFDVEIVQVQEEGHTTRTMLVAEQNSTHTTRPQIAMAACRVVSFVAITVISILAVGVVKGDTETVRALLDGWPFVLAVITPFVGWLDRYFGKLGTESRDRMAAITGQQKPGAVESIVNLISNTKRG